MLPIKVQGKSYNYPQSWEEVDFKTYLALLEGDLEKKKIDAIKIILNGLGIETGASKIEGLEVILKASQFIETTPAIDDKPVKLGEYTFPEDVTFESTEQFEDTGREIIRLMSTDLKQQTEGLALYAAIYCQGHKEPYDFEKAKYLSRTFLTYPCLEVMAVGSFFQAKWLSLEKNLPMNYLRKNTVMKKSPQDFKKLMRRLASTLHLTQSPDM